MSLRIIRNAKDLPIWFDISRYQKASNLDIRGWFANIAVRTEWLNNISPSNKTEFLEHMLADPILTPIEDLYYCPHVPISSLSIYSLVKLHQALMEYQQAIDPEDIIFCLNDPEIGPTHPFHFSVKDILRYLNSTTDGITHIEVNLNAPDELIISSFKKWLADERCKKTTSLSKRLNKAIGESDFADWIEKQLLAFVDIEIWSMLENIRITDNAIGAAIFPNEYDISLSERVRKVIRPLSRSVFNWTFLATMEPQLNDHTSAD